MSSIKLFVLLLITFSSLQLHVFSFEYQVGGIKGWIVPPYNDTTMYNDWASTNRFLVGDSIQFNYLKDSVMEVAFDDYVNCNSNHPKFFSNTGNTVYKLDTPGLYYFVSGVSGHCEKGQKMIIKVMSKEDAQSGGRGTDKSSAHSSNAAVVSFGVAKITFILSSFVAFCCH